MKIFRYIQSCFLLLSIGVLASCFDDKGNYEYDVIGEAVIKSIPGVTDQNNKVRVSGKWKDFLDSGIGIFSRYDGCRL